MSYSVLIKQLKNKIFKEILGKVCSKPTQIIHLLLLTKYQKVLMNYLSILSSMCIIEVKSKHIAYILN